MPVKNAVEWLAECISSIQRQTYSKWQLIAVDDFSSDTSYDLLSEYSAKDERIIVLKNNTPGITYALQLAFEHANGEYITRMDADDIMPPKKLETLLAIAQQSQNGIATGLVKYFGDEPISEGYQEYETWLNDRVYKADHQKHLFRECVVASPNWMTHRKNIERIAPFSAHTYPEDYDLVFRWIENGIEIIGVEEVTHLWREHQTRTSRTDERYNQEHFFKLKLNWFLKLKYNSARPLVIFGENVKAEMCKRFFAAKHISFIHLEKKNFDQLTQITNPLVLCTVFSNEHTRTQFESFFKQNKLTLGEDWWYV